jgi:hypothetical protein
LCHFVADHHDVLVGGELAGHRCHAKGAAAGQCPKTYYTSLFLLKKEGVAMKSKKFVGGLAPTCSLRRSPQWFGAPTGIEKFPLSQYP